MLSLITVVVGTVLDITAGYRTATATGTARGLLTAMRPVRLIFAD